MELWAATKETLYQYGGDTSSSPGPYPTAACPEFHVGCRLGREHFTLPSYAACCPWSHGLRPRKLYTSVETTRAPVRVLT